MLDNPKQTEGDAALSRTDFQWVRSQRGSTVCQLPHASNLPTSSTLLAHAFVYPAWSLRGLCSLLVSAQCSVFGCMPPLFSNAPSRASWGHAAWCIPRRTAGGGQRRFCSAHLRVSCTRSAGAGTGWARVRVQRIPRVRARAGWRQLTKAATWAARRM